MMCFFMVEILLVTPIFNIRITVFCGKKKNTDTYLVGPGYRTHVDYWMPFNGGIGLHDADWRSKFGGTIYEKNGSHGCINIPPKYADDVFYNVDKGTKVLVQK